VADMKSLLEIMIGQMRRHNGASYAIIL
jgi:hypothetical protein